MPLQIIRFQHDPDDEDDEPTFAPIILVREAPGATQAVCHVLDQFPDAVRIVQRLCAGAPRDQFDDRVYCCVTPEMFDMLAEADRAIALTGRGEHASAFLRLVLNEVVTGKNMAFGVAVGGQEVADALSREGYEVIPYDLPEPKGHTAWNADHLAEFVFGLLDPDDDGNDDDNDFEPEEADLPPDDGSDDMTLAEYVRIHFEAA